MSAIYQPNMVLSFTHTKSLDGALHIVFAQNKDDASILEDQFLMMLNEWGNKLLKNHLKTGSLLSDTDKIDVKPSEVCLTFSKSKKALSVVVLSADGSELFDHELYAILISWSSQAKKLIQGVKDDDKSRISSEM